VVVTDPPFFDNVHYSQLADFFFAWQRLILNDSPSHRSNTTRSKSEVQNADAGMFTERLTIVFQEAARVLKNNGLLVFTYHHSRWEGWRSVLDAIKGARFRIEACHPVKAEMSVATPKHQAKAPINFDIIMVCRKNLSVTTGTPLGEVTLLKNAMERAKTQVDRLRKSGWNLSRNDIGIVVMAQAVAEMSRQAGHPATEQLFEDIEGPVRQAIDLLYS
jgi:adenine-specific DNA methylase